MQSYPGFCRQVIRSHDAPAAACAACWLRVKARAGKRGAATGPEPPLSAGPAASRTECSIASPSASTLKRRPLIPGSGRSLLPRMMQPGCRARDDQAVAGDGGLTVTGLADQSPSLLIMASTSLTRTVANENQFDGVIGRRAPESTSPSLPVTGSTSLIRTVAN